MKKIILAEKPAAGKKISDAVGILTIPAVGHLLDLKPINRGWVPPYFDLVWKVGKKKEESLVKIVKNLREADVIYIATDYDAEGQLIAYNILHESGIPLDDVRRMKFSSLERDEIASSFENPIDFDVNLALSAEVRHYLDWYFGMNLSKVLTLKFKEEYSGRRKFYLTPVGRVQTPVLNYLVTKEKEIISFVDRDVWQVYFDGVYDSKYFEIGYAEFYNPDEAEEFTEVSEGFIADITEIKSEIVYYPPNKDYVVKRCLEKGISTDVVDYTLQDLYLDGYISYPRTESEKYTGVDTQKYLKRIATAFPEANEAIGNNPREGDIEGVHPAIYPIQPYREEDLSSVVFKIIVESFIKCHLPPEIQRHKNTYVNLGSGRVYSSFENPDLSVGDTFDLIYKTVKTKTKPPRRLNQNNIYGWMVEQRLGTVDTRTQIVSDMTKRWKGYAYEVIEGLCVSSKGLKIIETLQKMYPDIVGVDLTRLFESYIESVKNGIQKEKILLEGRNTVTEIVRKLAG